MTETRKRSCPLCEATCGLAFEVEEDRVVAVRGDAADPFSAGYLCAKAVGLIDVQHDPDRLTRPLRREGGRWRDIAWPAALEEAAERLAGIQRRHGADAVAVYFGNPTLHSYSATLAGLELVSALGTRNVYSTASVDHLPHLFAAYRMFGNKALLPVPDIDRTMFLLLFGSNPLVSNGSMMTAPDFPGRLERLRRRGGRFVVVDPARTRTAAIADAHLQVPPGSDVFLLLAILQVLFAERRVAPGGLSARIDGLDALRESVAPFAPEAVAARLDLEPATIRALARDFAAAAGAACHGRLGVCTQSFGGLNCWLINALNIVTGNLDRAGGVMLPTPAVDLAALARRLGQAGGHDRWRSRVRRAPEVCGELPLAVLAEEIATPGPGRVRGLITVAGNPVLSAPQGAALERALPGLETMVAVDFYLNESTRHADLVLPPPSPLERDHFDLLMHALAVRNVARYCPPLLAPPPGPGDDGRILLELAQGLARHKSDRRTHRRLALLRRLGLHRVLALLVRFGPHGRGWRPLGPGLRLEDLARAGTTRDLGPLDPGRFAQSLGARGRIDLAPAPMRADLGRVAAALRQGPEADAPLRLVGRREARGNNSWMHNARSLAKGSWRGTLFVHPDDLARLNLGGARVARLRSATGSLRVRLVATRDIRPGVVSLPHGYGHGRPGTRLSIANRMPGASVNEVTDAALSDPLSGTACLNGVSVRLEAEPTLRPQAASRGTDAAGTRATGAAPARATTTEPTRRRATTRTRDHAERT